MGMDGFPQDLAGVMKLINNYITENGNNRNLRRNPENSRRKLPLLKQNIRIQMTGKRRTERRVITVCTLESKIIGKRIVHI